ncbi:hypothetical protein [Leptolyngbya sp. 7M]|uniref:hypothetical protein n=1 Tax=Leptolyngbya sp. 7M TaxID=2812896 RepID=UPI001B8B6E23|nr:hypothetical protein [Leptolyngbya sp. 7M]QYO64627.1 hypothetical protein JVX88_34225 [Leptolyngbya sp. 7M]
MRTDKEHCLWWRNISSSADVNRQISTGHQQACRHNQGSVVMLAFALIALFIGTALASATVLVDSGLRGIAASDVVLFVVGRSDDGEV